MSNAANIHIRTVELLLAGDIDGLRRHAEKLSKSLAIQLGELCPECGGRDTESNGSTEFRCVGCDHRWGVDMGTRYGY